VVNKKSKSTQKTSRFFDNDKQTKRFFPEPWLMALYQKSKATDFEFAVSINRTLANAVIRNRVKRWTREFFRKCEGINGFKLLLVFKKSEQKLSQLQSKQYFDVCRKIATKIEPK
jgi:ribonuclease P protein component